MVKCPGVPGVPRVGLVVAKSTGNAVIRNRIKRRLRHALRAVQLKPGTDYVIIATSQVADAPHPQLMGWLERVVEDGNA
jgi:ribonuclease P protein component